MAKRILVVLTTAPAALVACHSSDDLPTKPPDTVTKVTSGGFISPSDAVSSPDGKTFYFTALSDQLDDNGERQPAIFRTASEPGSKAEALAIGAPLASPMGLVMSCDGGTLYIADMGNEHGNVFSLAAEGGAVTDMGATSIFRPAGLAMGPDCKTLFITGRSDDGKPSLFSMSADGGSASAVYSGDPLTSPTGLHVDTDGVAWVMDHYAVGKEGEGVLFAISKDGSRADEVVSNLRMGTPGGVSLVAGGGTAVMPTLDAAGKAQLTEVDIASGERTEVPAKDMLDPAGLRTAKRAGVFAVVDSEAGAIYRAE